jgi:hypothetical protein
MAEVHESIDEGTSAAAELERVQNETARAAAKSLSSSRTPPGLMLSLRRENASPSLADKPENSLTKRRTPTVLNSVNTQGGHENKAFIWRTSYSRTTTGSMSLRLTSFGAS